MFWAEAASNLTFGTDGARLYRQLPFESLLPREYVATLLERSSPCSITVTVRHHSDSPAQTCAIPQVLHRVAHHIVILSIELPLFLLVDLYDILQTAVSSLEHLSITVLEPNHNWLASQRVEQVDLVRWIGLRPVPHDKLPRLQSVATLPPLFPSLAVKSLCQLYLFSFPISFTNLEFDELCAALRRCPNLEELNFSWGALRDLSVSASALGTVDLPYLQKFDSESNDPATVHQLLTILSIPPTTSICVDFVDHIQRAVDMLPLPLVSYHQSDNVRISVSPGPYGPPSYCTWHVNCLKGDTSRIWMTFDSSERFGILGFEGMFRTVRITRLEVQDNSPLDMNAIDDWLAFLDAFPQLTHLTVRGLDGPSKVLSALASPRTSIESSYVTARVTCPSLKHLVLGWDVPGPSTYLTPASEGVCHLEAYSAQDVEHRIQRRCSSIRPAIEERTSLGAPHLESLEIYEYESSITRAMSHRVKPGQELIPSSRRDDRSSPCLASLRGAAGGPVVYRGYMFLYSTDI